jgi:CRISPR-associated protein Cas2
MTVILVNRVPQRLRGLLARYCLEVRAGVFVGKVDARLRDLLWHYVEHYVEDEGASVMIWRESTEQGYGLRTCGDDRRQPVYRDGLWLIDEMPV